MVSIAIKDEFGQFAGQVNCGLPLFAPVVKPAPAYSLSQKWQAT